MIRRKKWMKEKTIFLSVFLFLFIFTVTIYADIYIKEQTHTDSYYYGGVVNPATDSVQETWFENNQFTNKTPGRIIIIDNNKKLISILNRNDKTYVQASIPLDMAKIVPQQLLGMLQARAVKGTVKESQETKKIDIWNCRCYEIEVNQPYGLEVKVWSTTDVPFNWETLIDNYTNLRRLANYSEEYITALKTIKGLGIKTDITVFLQGISFQIKSQIVEITQKSPPADIYSIPSGYTKKEQLTTQDLRNR